MIIRPLTKGGLHRLCPNDRGVKSFGMLGRKRILENQLYFRFDAGILDFIKRSMTISFWTWPYFVVSYLDIGRDPLVAINSSWPYNTYHARRQQRPTHCGRTAFDLPWPFQHFLVFDTTTIYIDRRPSGSTCTAFLCIFVLFGG